jgi:hypothetical protein
MQPNTWDEPVQAQTLGTFKSARGLSIAVIILLSIHAALSALLVAAWPTITNIITAGEDYSPDGLWDAVCAIAVGLTAVLQWGVFIACAVCFLCWLYRSYANLPALGSQSIIYSPKSAVTGWFIPFVNLVQGYKSVATLYAESQRGTTPAGYPVAVTTPIVGLWWAAYLARGITSRIADKMLDRAYDGTLGWLITAELLDIVAAVLCIVIVYRIEKRQRDQHIDLVRRNAAAAPPPVDRLR